MAEHGRRTISPATLALAALASATTTFLIGSVGLAGTIVGAALTPVLVAFVTELARRPADRLRTTSVRLPSSRGGERTVFRVEREPRPLLDRVSWRRVLVTGVGAFALVVVAVTLADLGGTSVASDRGTTFFDRGGGGAAGDDEPAGGGGGAPTAPPETTPAETPTGEQLEPPATTEPTPTTPTGTTGATTTTAP